MQRYDVDKLTSLPRIKVERGPFSGRGNVKRQRQGSILKGSTSKGHVSSEKRMEPTVEDWRTWGGGNRAWKRGRKVDTMKSPRGGEIK